MMHTMHTLHIAAHVHIGASVQGVHCIHAHMHTPPLGVCIVCRCIPALTFWGGGKTLGSRLSRPAKKATPAPGVDVPQSETMSVNPLLERASGLSLARFTRAAEYCIGRGCAALRASARHGEMAGCGAIENREVSKGDMWPNRAFSRLFRRSNRLSSGPVRQFQAFFELAGRLVDFKMRSTRSVNVYAVKALRMFVADARKRMHQAACRPSRRLCVWSNSSARCNFQCNWSTCKARKTIKTLLLAKDVCFSDQKRDGLCIRCTTLWVNRHRVCVSPRAAA